MQNTGFNLKELVIAIFLVASGVLNAYFWYELIGSLRFDDIAFLLLPVASLLFLTICFSCVALFIKNTIIGYGAAIAAFVGGFFFVNATSFAITLLVLALGAITWAFHRIRQEATSATVFRLSKILRQGLPLFFTAVALLISLFYFVKIAEDSNQPVIPRSVFDISLPFLEGAFKGILPGFRAHTTVDELLLDALRSQEGNEVDIAKIPRSQLDMFLKEQRAALGKGLGITITGKEQAADFLYNLTNQKIGDFVGPYKQYLPYLSVIGFFLAIKALTLPFYFISLGLVYIVMRVLLAVRVLRREKAMIEVERIIL